VNELELATEYPELILRFADDGDGRTLEGYAVPWNEPALVARPIKGFEEYRRGSLTRSLEESRKPIVLLGGHRESEPVGKLVASHDDEYGQHVRFRLLDTRAAKDAAELVREQVWTGLSIGGTAVPSRTTVTRRPDGELSIVRKPAFAGAGVTMLRHEELGDELPPERDLRAVVEARARRRARLLEA
jgi:HK97 family phage prohead protease